jgi:hypothetical protein
MRSILMAVMLILTVITIYINTVGGEGGTNDSVRQRGGSVNSVIERMNP